MKIYKMHWAVMFLAISASKLWASQLLIKTQSDKIPSEFIMLIEHINKQLKNNDDLNTVYHNLKIINESLQNQNKSTVMFLLKSEIYRGILENQIVIPLKDAQVGKSLFESNEKKLAKYKDTYSSFSYYIYQAIHYDLAPFHNSGLLYQYSKVDTNDAKLRSDADKIKVRLKYEATWAHLFSAKDPIEFNQIISQLILFILDNIKTKAQFLKQNIGDQNQEESALLFQIPQVNEENEDDDEQNATLSNIKTKASQAAQKTTEKIDQIDFNDAHNKIDQILEKEEELSSQKNKAENLDSQWQPAD